MFLVELSREGHHHFIRSSELKEAAAARLILRRVIVDQSLEARILA